MRQIPKKNYYILAVLLILTVLLTLFLSNLYLTKDMLTSNFYEYSNKLTKESFDQFMIENSDVIIYISDKYDLTNETFEKDFMKKIDELNLKHNLIYIDKSELDKKFLNKLKSEYKINIDIKKIPTLVVLIDNKVVKNIYINKDSNVDTLIEYEDFE